MSRTARAADSVLRSVACAIGANAARAASVSKVDAPPMNRAGSRMPRTASASVTVGLGAAAPVAGGAGDRARTARADPQRPAPVDPGQRAAARADRVHGHRRQRDDHVVLDLELGGHDRLPADHDRAVRARPADVERDEVRRPEALPAALGARDAPGRPGLQRVRRTLAGGGHGEHATVGLHHHQRTGVAGLGEAALGAVEVALHRRPDVGVDHGRREARVLLEARVHAGRRPDRHLGQLGGDRRRAPFVLVVGVGVEEADQDRLDPAPDEEPDLVGQRLLVQRDDLAPGAVDPPGHRAAQPARAERLAGVAERPLPARVELVAAGALSPAHGQDVAEPLGRDHPDRRAGAREHGVEADRAAVQDQRDLRHRDPERVDAGEEPLGLVVRGGGHLARRHRAGDLVHRHAVGEGSPDVDPDPVHQGAPSVDE